VYQQSLLGLFLTPGFGAEPGPAILGGPMIKIGNAVGALAVVGCLCIAGVGVAGPASALPRSQDCSTALAQVKTDHDMFLMYAGLSDEAYANGDDQNGYGWMRISNLWLHGYETAVTIALNAGCF
jgi:hypothetical protein